MPLAGFHLHGPVSNMDKMLGTGCKLYLGMQENLEELREIKRRVPDATILFRYYHPNTMRVEPEARAEEICRYIARNDLLALTNRIIPWNEQNLHYEHGEPIERQTYWDSGDGHRQVADWGLRFIRRIRELLPSVILVGPCNSPRSPQVLVADMAELYREFDELGLHVYGDSTLWVLKKYLESFPNYDVHKKVWITEYNQWSFVSLLKELENIVNILGVVWFLWETHDKQHFEQFEMCNDDSTIQQLTEYNQQTPSDGDEGGQPVVEGIGAILLNFLVALTVDQQVGVQYGVPWQLLVAMQAYESTWNSQAINENTDGSKDWGLNQINDIWHPDFNLQLWDRPEYNTQYACDLILSRYTQSHDWYDAIQPWYARDKAWLLFQELMKPEVSAKLSDSWKLLELNEVRLRSLPLAEELTRLLRMVD